MVCSVEPIVFGDHAICFNCNRLQDSRLGGGGKADYFSAKGVVTFIKKDNCMYMACSSPDCNKKVVEVS